MYIVEPESPTSSLIIQSIDITMKSKDSTTTNTFSWHFSFFSWPLHQYPVYFPFFGYCLISLVGAKCIPTSGAKNAHILGLPTSQLHNYSNTTMGVAEDVNVVATAIEQFLDNTLNEVDLPIILHPVLSHTVAPLEAQVKGMLDKIEHFNEFEANAEAEDTTREKISTFNSTLVQQSRNFVVKMAFTTAADALANKLRSEDDNAEKPVNFKGIPCTTLQHNVLNLFLLLLDVLIAFAGHESFPSAQNDFYLVLQLIVESLVSLSSEVLEAFWYALESRQQAISTVIFDQKITLNRIAMLGICNSITDRYYRRGKSGKYDSYEKDSFNDNLHARVRTFLSSLLLFDDLTGLNKYFAIANRVNREPNLGMAKNGDEELLRDILQFHRLLRDPYHYLKSPHLLSRQVESLDRLYGYLLDEETKYAKKHPVPEVFKVKEPILEDTRARLTKHYERAVFFPEHYWLSPFEEIQKGAEFDALKAEDQRIALKRFDSSRFRRLLLIQMYLVSAFFLELQASRKREVVRRIGAPANTKHIKDDNTPEVLIKTFLKIKREIPRLCRTWDTQLAFLLQHVSQSEENWMEWLIYGKNAQGKPLLGTFSIPQEEIEIALEKFDKVAPYKTKRYFNTHATPQLSRKMRTKTGLSLLLATSEAESDYDAKISELTDRISSEADESVKHELQEERSLLLWRLAKSLRAKEWLKVSEVVNVDILGVEKAEEPKKIEEPKIEEPEKLENGHTSKESITEKDEQMEDAVTEESQEQKESSEKNGIEEQDASENKDTETSESLDDAGKPEEGENHDNDAQPESRKRARSPDEEEDATAKKSKLA